MADSYLDVGESYQKLRKFNKAIKWYKKCWEMYKTIGNLEVKFSLFHNISLMRMDPLMTLSCEERHKYKDFR